MTSDSPEAKAATDAAYAELKRSEVLMEPLGSADRGTRLWEVYEARRLAGDISDEDFKGMIGDALTGDRIAAVILQSTAASYVTAGLPVPSVLREYTKHFLLNADLDVKTKKGPNPHTHKYRNFFVARTVFRTVQLGFPPTRSGSEPSACSIVAAAYKQLRKGGLTENAIVKIWGAHKGMWGL